MKKISTVFKNFPQGLRIGKPILPLSREYQPRRLGKNIRKGKDIKNGKLRKRKIKNGTMESKRIKMQKSKSKIDGLGVNI